MTFNNLIPIFPACSKHNNIASFFAILLVQSNSKWKEKGNMSLEEEEKSTLALASYMDLAPS